MSIYPPDDLRPYFQDGYLAGTEDLTTDYDSKPELDFNNRLIAKFIIPNWNKFWGKGFSKIPHSILYPKNDKVLNLCKDIKTKLNREITPGRMGVFLKEWIAIESIILKSVRERESRIYSIRKAINVLNKKYKLSENILLQLQSIRIFRNQLVIGSQQIEPKRLALFIESTKVVKKELILFIKKIFN